MPFLVRRARRFDNLLELAAGRKGASVFAMSAALAFMAPAASAQSVGVTAATVGGNISKKKAVTITTPSSAITIRGGIMMVAVDTAETKATFLYGQAMTVTGHGRTQVVTRPGWGVRTVSGSSPEQAMPIAPGVLAGHMAMLEGPGSRSIGRGGVPAGPRPQMSRGQPDTRSTAQGPGVLNDQASASVSPGVKQGEPVDEAISRSGLPDINSGRGLRAQGGTASGKDGSARVGPPPPDGSAANRPMLPDNMGSNSPLPSGLPARQ